MKGNMRISLRFASALALLALLGILGVQPVSAGHNTVTTSVTASPNTAGDLAEYTFTFNVSADIPANVGEVRVTFDKDTQVPASIGRTNFLMQADHLTNTSCSTPPCADTIGADQVVTLNQDPTSDTDPVDARRVVWIIKVPDMNPGSTIASGGLGAQGIASGARVNVIFTTGAGIKNPTVQETSEFDLKACTSTCSTTGGNVISSGPTASFTVQVTFDSLCRLTKQFVSNAGVSESLCAKLNAAKAAAARGNGSAKAGALRAYTNEASAQSGKALTFEEAAVLAQLARAL